MDPVDAERLLERSLRERIPGITNKRLVLVVSAARWLVDQVLRDGHLAASEREQVRQSLGADLSAEEIDWVLEVLVTSRRELGALRPHYWLDALARFLMGGQRVQDPGQFVQQNLPGRWPMMPDSPRGVLTQHLEPGPNGIQLGDPRAMSSLTIRWHELTTLEPVQPWPELLVEWREDGQLRRSRVAPSGDPEGFEAKVEALFDAAEKRVPDAKLPTGWLGTPRALWEDVEALPTGDTPARGADYRTSPQERDAVVAVRPARGGLGVMLEWLASGPMRPFRSMVREAVLTERYLYVRRRNGQIQRIPLELLAERSGEDDAIYRFGRGTTVLLSGATSCPVCRGLDLRVAFRAAPEPVSSPPA
jgi:hypothetical protein